MQTYHSSYHSMFWMYGMFWSLAMAVLWCPVTCMLVTCQNTVPLTTIRSNSKFDENSQLKAKRLFWSFCPHQASNCPGTGEFGYDHTDKGENINKRLFSNLKLDVHFDNRTDARFGIQRFKSTRCTSRYTGCTAQYRSHRGVSGGVYNHGFQK